jgi:hypothetical protein
MVLANVVSTLRTIELTGAHAAVPETTSQSRTDTDRCGPVSRINSLFPCTTRSPFLTRVSDGKPLRRLLVRSKAEIAVRHDTLLASSRCGTAECYTRTYRRADAVIQMASPTHPSKPAQARTPQRMYDISHVATRHGTTDIAASRV